MQTDTGSGIIWSYAPQYRQLIHQEASHNIPHNNAAETMEPTTEEQVYIATLFKNMQEKNEQQHAENRRVYFERERRLEKLLKEQNATIKELKETVAALQMQILIQNAPKNVVKPEHNSAIEYIFPVCSSEELEELEERLADKQFGMIVTEYLRQITGLSNRKPGRALSRVINDELLHKFSWDGSNGKQKLSSLMLFNTILFDAWRNDRYQRENYLQEMRIILRSCHARCRTSANKSPGGVPQVKFKNECA